MLNNTDKILNKLKQKEMEGQGERVEDVNGPNDVAGRQVEAEGNGMRNLEKKEVERAAAHPNIHCIPI